MPDTSNFIPQITADGSFTFFSDEFGETFHSRQGASEEAELKFVLPTDLRSKALQPSLNLLDVCYGLGYNTAAALATIWAVNPSCRVELVGLELDLAVPQAAIAHHLLNNWPQPIPEILSQLATSQKIKSDRLQATLLIGDARNSIQQVQLSGFKADAVFLDPFSPPSCPQLWTIEFLSLVAQCLKWDGRLATYSCAAAVRTALIAAGLQISSTPPVGRRSPGTVAFREFPPESLYTASVPLLSVQEQEYLQTRAAIPYRDPDLSSPAAVILHRRQIEQQASSLEPTSQWKKRWFAP
ncbi:MAG TPA: MnmC family methyltransferase [Candidatus Obscuribacterales bacterium]